jgi:anti-sigma-K factor RskA
MTNETHVLALLPAYLLGSLESDEASRVKEHLLSCWICRVELDKFQNVVDELSFAAPVSTPSPDLKDRLLQRVHSARSQPYIPAQTRRRPWLERLLPIWGLASLFLIVALSAFNFLLWQRLDRLELRTSSGGMHAFPLRASAAVSQATGFILVSADGMNGALVVDRLPPLGKNRQYQLWLIRDGQRTSGAVFSTDEESYGGTRVEIGESLLEYSSVDVTIEPVGGSLQPTGEPVLGGLLSSP